MKSERKYSLRLMKWLLSRCKFYETHFALSDALQQEYETFRSENGKTKSWIWCGYHTIEVLIPRYDLIIKPWENWSSNNIPSWWSDYNKVKHHRDDNFSKANLFNAINSVSGLFAIVLYLYQTEKGKNYILSPYPQILTLDKRPASLGARATYGLPDF